jgi:hypothetical protein
MMSEVIDDTKLSIRIEGATEAEIARGIAAAQFVFARAYTTAWEAAYAALRREDYIPYFDDNGEISGPHMTAEELRICDLWDEADSAAVLACCERWAEKPERANLEIIE